MEGLHSFFSPSIDSTKGKHLGKELDLVALVDDRRRVHLFWGRRGRSRSLGAHSRREDIVQIPGWRLRQRLLSHPWLGKE